MNKQDFLKEVAFYAVADYERSKVLPSLTIAQAILESGWGKSGLAKNSNNLFGIKAGSSWKAAKRLYPTKEFLNGKWVTVQAFFREYSTFKGSIKDHNDLLLRPRYKKVISSTNYKEACHEIWKAGYATDPNYPKLLISIIEQHKLQRYDEEALYVLKPEDANKLIRLVQTKYAEATTDEQRRDWHRLAEELRRVSGQK